MRPIQLLRPRYVADRVRLAVHQRMHPDAPWLTAEATSRLDQHLEPHHVGVEWGSGRSTVWFAKRVGHLLSVEHHAGWHASVSTRIASDGIHNVDYRLHPCEPERVETPDWIAAMFASEYVRAVDAFDARSIDFALVDGMYRSVCALAVIPKLKPGALLVVDNVNWFLPSKSRAPSSRHVGDSPLSPTWQEFAQIVRAWELEWTQNGVADTAIWRVPGGRS
jgi:methyltransferase family protein